MVAVCLVGYGSVGLLLLVTSFGGKVLVKINTPPPMTHQRIDSAGVLGSRSRHQEIRETERGRIRRVGRGKSSHHGEEEKESLVAIMPEAAADQNASSLSTTMSQEFTRPTLPSSWTVLFLSQSSLCCYFLFAWLIRKVSPRLTDSLEKIPPSEYFYAGVRREQMSPLRSPLSFSSISSVTSRWLSAYPAFSPTSLGTLCILSLLTFCSNVLLLSACRMIGIPLFLSFASSQLFVVFLGTLFLLGGRPTAVQAACCILGFVGCALFFWGSDPAVFDLFSPYVDENNHSLTSHDISTSRLLLGSCMSFGAAGLQSSYILFFKRVVPKGNILEIIGLQGLFLLVVGIPVLLLLLIFGKTPVYIPLSNLSVTFVTFLLSTIGFYLLYFLFFTIAMRYVTPLSVVIGTLLLPLSILWLLVITTQHIGQVMGLVAIVLSLALLALGEMMPHHVARKRFRSSASEVSTTSPYSMGIYSTLSPRGGPRQDGPRHLWTGSSASQSFPTNP